MVDRLHNPSSRRLELFNFNDHLQTSLWRPTTRTATMMMDMASRATETIIRTMQAKGITTNTTIARMDTMTSRKRSLVCIYALCLGMLTIEL